MMRLTAAPALPAAMLAMAAALLPSLAAAADAPAPTAAADFGVAPWSEAVVSVADLDASAAWLVSDGGWREIVRGRMSRGELDYWGLPAAVSGAFLLICAPAADSGCIRYLRFDNAEGQRPIRLAARPWDTGGIFSIMLRSENVAAQFDAAIARGWWAESPPYAFRFGGSDLVNVVITGPHGVNYALYQRDAPPFDGFPVGRLSQAFNAMRMVKDQPAALAFYRDRLGFGVLFDAPFTDPEARPNNFSVPANLATTLVRRAAVAQPVLPGETGRVEVMQFEGFAGRDLSQFAAPPNWGILALRYPVADLAGYRAFLAAKGVTPVYEAKGIAITGIGSADIIAVRDPDGNLTEFYHAR
ncbi:VOC family protein [Erythrobacter sp. BLCC-B19]|uniref:VOC family protein n=1 Tax=Erythrobacter sp. BLCC-B19 TaxID=3025315 RepID=UPI002361CC34|nr:VOC family protein [Erythrobacter sp. BLCC-B19]WDA41357.1 VOC family protein [Erythrobacter sp. BLCC-B19]